jgi:hypothetical protein
VTGDRVEPGQLRLGNYTASEIEKGVDERRLCGVIGVLAPAQQPQAMPEDRAVVSLVELCCIRLAGSAPLAYSLGVDGAHGPTKVVAVVTTEATGAGNAGTAARAGTAGRAGTVETSVSTTSEVDGSIATGSAAGGTCVLAATGDSTGDVAFPGVASVEGALSAGATGREVVAS